jgi:hypothetical protein
MPPKIRDRVRNAGFVVAVLGLTLCARPATAQNYPWCANFADGAGTNCGFSTEQQCMVTVTGSGGYCSQNNRYEPAVSAAPARRATAKHHAASSTPKN